MAFSPGQDDDEVMSEINMIPLVDVMLVLLIIFMLTVPVMTQSVDIMLPQTVGKATEPEPDAVTIAVDAAGRIFWNEDEKPIDRQMLALRLASVASQTPQPQIRINGDKKASYEYVMQVMTSAQQAGLTQLGFVTEISQ